MSINYQNLIGGMKSSISSPTPELEPYIEKYEFYENGNIKDKDQLKPLSNGKVEMYIHYNNSHLYISGTKKKSRPMAFL